MFHVAKFASRGAVRGPGETFATALPSAAPVEDGPALSRANQFALRDDFVHPGDLSTDISNDFFRRHASGRARSGDFRPSEK